MVHKLAIIGFGGMGRYHHECIQKQIPEIEVAGIYDIQSEVSEEAAAMGLKVYGCLNDLLSDLEIEIVTIATPNDVHKDLVISCLNSGKNVVCEKPAALNSSELEEMIEAAKHTGKLFTVHQNRRWDRDYNIIKKILNDDIIGLPYFIESRVQGSRRSLHGWRGYQINGGGMVLDWGVHLVDQLLDLITSAVVSVDAHLLSVFSSEVDDSFKAFFRFENGVSALIEIATNCFINQPRWHMSCKQGTAVIENWNCDGKIVRIKTDKVMKWDNDIIYTAAGPTRTMAPRPDETTEQIPLPKVNPNWSEFYHNIIDVIEGREELVVKPEQVLRVMKVIDLIFKSNKEGVGLKCYI